VKRLIKSQVGAFSLVELVIVIVIMGIIAAIAMQRFSSASEKAMVNQIVQNLVHLNNAAYLYELEHDCPLGKYGQICISKFGEVRPLRQLCQSTDKWGSGLKPSGSLGPYLRSYPVNPLTNSSLTKRSNDFYNPVTHQPTESLECVELGSGQAVPDSPARPVGSPSGSGSSSGPQAELCGWHYNQNTYAFNVYVDPEVMSQADLEALAAPANIRY